ncbi:hypothetical protein DYB32_001679 [Aphanomyces invadans]|uniref:Uncharacterized protein n=1 Tax=Aphanomyces invadans TaxID=157072 RepID=A0A418B5F6_9STRA|nr:hypothetical protein DYB32_001679 [Aphanomyces invadans]
MAPLEGQLDDTKRFEWTQPTVACYDSNTVSVVSAPRHWRDFAFVRNASHVEFEEGSVAHDVHVEGLRNVQEIGFRQCDFIQSPHALARCRSLRFMSCENLHDLGELTSVKHLNISGSRTATNVHKLTLLESLVVGSTYPAALPSVATSLTAAAVSVPWSSMPLVVSELHLKHCQSLSGCEMLEDVSSLGGVHALDLSYCTRIRDVSALGFVHTLNLAGTLVEVVADLKTVYDLNLSGCPCVNDDQVNALGLNHTLNLMGCSKLTRVDGLRFVHTLNIANCVGLTDVSMLRHVHTLDLTGCIHLEPCC